MKKTWNVVSKLDGRILTETPLKGTQQQAEVFMNMKFDSQHCELKEQKTIELEELEFDVDLSEVITCNWNCEEQFILVHKKGEFILTDNDGFKVDIIDVEHLKQFPNFKRLIFCEQCEGSGHYLEPYACDKVASMCCGGCIRPVECDCESVIFAE
jgi:hypothetical protein